MSATLQENTLLESKREQIPTTTTKETKREETINEDIILIANFEEFKTEVERSALILESFDRITVPPKGFPHIQFPFLNNKRVQKTIQESAWVKVEHQKCALLLVRSGALGDAAILMDSVSGQSSLTVNETRTLSLESWDSKEIQECSFVLLLSQLIKYRFTANIQYINNIKYLLTRGIICPQFHDALGQYPETFSFLFRVNIEDRENSEHRKAFARAKADCLISLLKGGVSAAFSDETRFGILNHLIPLRSSFFYNDESHRPDSMFSFSSDRKPKSLPPEDLTKEEYELLLKLALTNGATSLSLFWETQLGGGYGCQLPVATFVSTLYQVLRIPSHNLDHFGYSFGYQDDIPGFIHYLAFTYKTFFDFGAGLLCKEKRFPVFKLVSFGRIDPKEEDLIKKLNSIVQELIKLGAWNNEINAEKLRTLDFVLWGLTVDNKTVLICNLPHLENVLSNTSKSPVIIPNLERITQTVLEADEEDLAPGIKALFLKYRNNCVPKFNFDRDHPRFYQQFKEAVLRTKVVTSGKPYDSVSSTDYNYFKFEKTFDRPNPNYRDVEVIENGISICEKWLSNNILDALYVLAKANAERNFFELMTQFGKRFGFEKLIALMCKTISIDYFQVSGRLLMFYAVSRKNGVLLKFLIKPKILSLIKKDNAPLDIVIGSNRNSLLQEFVCSSVMIESKSDSKECLTEEEIWDALIKSPVNTQHRNASGKSILAFLMGQYKSDWGTVKERDLEKILSLLKNGASPFDYVEEDVSVLAVAGRRMCQEKKALTEIKGNKDERLHESFVKTKSFRAIFSIFLELCEHGAGLARKEHRVPLGFDISLLCSQLKQAENDYGNFYFSSNFSEKFLTSSIAIRARTTAPALNPSGFTWIFEISELERIVEEAIYGVEGAVYIPNLLLICQNVLRAEEGMIDPKVVNLFMRLAMNGRRFMEQLGVGGVGFPDAVSSIIQSYDGRTITFEDFQPTKALSVSLPFTVKDGSHPSNTRVYPFTQEEFVDKQFRAWRWFQSQVSGDGVDTWCFGGELWGQGKEPYFTQLVKRDDNNPDNRAAMQALIDNGLLVMAIAEGQSRNKGRSLELSCVLSAVRERKPQYLRMLVKAGFQVEYFERSSLSEVKRPIIVAIENKDMEAVEILIDGGAELNQRSEYSMLHELANERKCLDEFLEVLKRKGLVLPLIRKEGDLWKNFEKYCSIPSTDRFKNETFDQLIEAGFLTKEGLSFHRLQEVLEKLIYRKDLVALKKVLQSKFVIDNFHLWGTGKQGCLSAAISERCLEAAEMLIDAGCKLYISHIYYGARFSIESIIKENTAYERDRDEKEKFQEAFLGLLQRKGIHLATFPMIANLYDCYLEFLGEYGDEVETLQSLIDAGLLHYKNIDINRIKEQLLAVEKIKCHAHLMKHLDTLKTGNDSAEIQSQVKFLKVEVKSRFGATKNIVVDYHGVESLDLTPWDSIREILKVQDRKHFNEKEFCRLLEPGFLNLIDASSIKSLGAHDPMSSVSALKETSAMDASTTGASAIGTGTFAIQQLREVLKDLVENNHKEVLAKVLKDPFVVQNIHVWWAVSERSLSYAVSDGCDESPKFETADMLIDLGCPLYAWGIDWGTDDFVFYVSHLYRCMDASYRDTKEKQDQVKQEKRVVFSQFLQKKGLVLPAVPCLPKLEDFYKMFLACGDNPKVLAQLFDAGLLRCGNIDLKLIKEQLLAGNKKECLEFLKQFEGESKQDAESTAVVDKVGTQVAFKPLRVKVTDQDGKEIIMLVDVLGVSKAEEAEVTAENPPILRAYQGLISQDNHRITAPVDTVFKAAP